VEQLQDGVQCASSVREQRLHKVDLGQVKLQWADLAQVRKSAAADESRATFRELHDRLNGDLSPVCGADRQKLLLSGHTCPEGSAPLRQSANRRHFQNADHYYQQMTRGVSSTGSPNGPQKSSEPDSHVPTLFHIWSDGRDGSVADHAVRVSAGFLP
jgi:hypothetical protein